MCVCVCVRVVCCARLCVWFHHCTSLLTRGMSDNMNTNIHLQYQATKHLSSYAKHLISKFLFACQCKCKSKWDIAFGQCVCVCVCVHACVWSM